MRSWSTCTFLALALSGCGEDETAPTAADVEAIFDARCVSCHTGDDAPAGQNLTLGVAAVVDVASTEVPTMVRIAPGSLEDSYLWHKVSGTAASVGGVDTQMPLDGTGPLSQAELDTISGWIEAGAPE
jgi:mono/diheme cytochrome c family protein